MQCSVDNVMLALTMVIHVEVVDRCAVNAGHCCVCS